MILWINPPFFTLRFSSLVGGQSSLPCNVKHSWPSCLLLQNARKAHSNQSLSSGSTFGQVLVRIYPFWFPVITPGFWQKLSAITLSLIRKWPLSKVCLTHTLLWSDPCKIVNSKEANCTVPICPVDYLSVFSFAQMRADHTPLWILWEQLRYAANHYMRSNNLLYLFVPIRIDSLFLQRESWQWSCILFKQRDQKFSAYWYKRQKK